MNTGLNGFFLKLKEIYRYTVETGEKFTSNLYFPQGGVNKSRVIRRPVKQFESVKRFKKDLKLNYI